MTKKKLNLDHVDTRLLFKDEHATPGDVAFLESYQQWVYSMWNFHDWEAKKKKVFPSIKDDAIMALGLAGESGEVVDCMKKIIRGKRKFLGKDIKEIEGELLLELGDVLYYLTMIANRFNISLKDVIESNVKKLEERAVRANKK
jgi:NTP pyrophosphatase (non-canonical NTP hydrolase)